ncbi:hypothetical protein K6119_09745 [Paracrocinitomix mangrovi]|uniref:hypothetical protein n=1 Tax=Paracrocinitomix mangrovi TaxID=2862509 RepID=UPI001C8D9094|nr:hypothetical protein [Paracrocinitomix mangrovi]UKN03772.1 hypothetical protein K6119_09745 [Paracrocinitomix mangrovi]
MRYLNTFLILLVIVLFSCNNMPELNGKWELTSANFEPISLTAELNCLELNSEFDFKEGILVVNNDGEIINSKYDDSSFKSDSIIIIKSELNPTEIKMTEYDGEVMSFEIVVDEAYWALPVPNSFAKEFYSRWKKGWQFELSRIEN